MNIFRYTVIVKRDGDGRFRAICPALEGCVTEGETEDEARSLIERVMEQNLRDLLKAGKSIPEEVEVTQVQVAL